MKILGWLLALLLLIGLMALGVVHVNTVKQKNAKIQQVQRDLTKTSEILRNTKAENLQLKVFEKEFDVARAKVAVLEQENAQLKARLARFTEAASTKLTRQVLVDKVVGMTAQEVVALVGEPVRRLGPKSEFWYYDNGITRDPKTNQPDELVQLVFENGKVTRVSFK